MKKLYMDIICALVLSGTVACETNSNAPTSTWEPGNKVPTTVTVGDKHTAESLAKQGDVNSEQALTEKNTVIPNNENIGTEDGAPAATAEAINTAGDPVAGDALLVGKKIVLPIVIPTLPKGWRKTGILERAKKLPKRAPKWARMAAKVVSKKGQRYLECSAWSGKIRNPALARTTASDRARALVSKWLGTRAVSGVEIVKFYEKKKIGAFAKARVLLPKYWPEPEPTSMTEVK